jgi:predicted transglutaminase-like cysteine proteinase
MGTSWGDRAVRACLAAAVLLLTQAAAARADDVEPFALDSVSLPANHPLAAIWQRLRSGMQAESAAVAQCRTDTSMCGSPIALQFIAIGEAAEMYGGLYRAGRIGRAVNLALRKVNRLAADGGATDWTTPLQALRAGAGDCKQFAVLKYAALRAAGFGDNDVRLLVVMNKAQQEPHAVVAVRHGADWFILDSVTMTVVASRQHQNYEPLFSLDGQGVRRFVLPSFSASARLPAPRAAAQRTPPG